MIKVIEYKNKIYPDFQTKGNAAKYIIPFAQESCQGYGVDVGCNRIEWCYPGAIPIDPVIDPNVDALNFPQEELDYIFSSHCLEHLNNWVNVLDYWYNKLKTKGVLFLYLPDYSQEYWRPWNNRKHLNIFNGEILRDYMQDRGYENIFVSGIDLNNSFAIMGQKK